MFCRFRFTESEIIDPNHEKWPSIRPRYTNSCLEIRNIHNWSWGNSSCCEEVRFLNGCIIAIRISKYVFTRVHIISSVSAVRDWFIFQCPSPRPRKTQHWPGLFFLPRGWRRHLRRLRLQPLIHHPWRASMQQETSSALTTEAQRAAARKWKPEKAIQKACV